MFKVWSMTTPMYTAFAIFSENDPFFISKDSFYEKVKNESEVYVTWRIKYLMIL